MKKVQQSFAKNILFYSRVVAGLVLILLIILSAGFVFVLQSKQIALTHTQTEQTAKESVQQAVTPFPLGVNPQTQTITEQQGVDTYLTTHFAQEKSSIKTSFLNRIQKKLLTRTWYQNLASPHSRVLVIYAGQRQEEVTDAFGDIMGWDDEQRAVFTLAVSIAYPNFTEGVFFPGKYIVEKNAPPEQIAHMVTDRFTKNIMLRYSTEVAQHVPAQTALIVASLLEREAYTFEDMRIISGVVWNRLFNDMKLQLDATLQYARGSEPHEPFWWPQVVPDDKYVQSPYNTYQHKGLPPAPIANPSAAAVLAALNPQNSDCLFYFHDERGDLFCSANYQEHVEKLRSIYGRGQ